MTYSEEHLIERISDTEKAIEKYTSAANQDKAFISEFQESSPETAQIYRDWETFNQEKVDYFQIELQVLLTRKI